MTQIVGLSLCKIAKGAIFSPSDVLAHNFLAHNFLAHNFLANNVLAKPKERAVNTLLPCYLMFWELLWASVSGRALNHLSLFIFDDFL
jgi:hypothetical protein